MFICSHSMKKLYAILAVPILLTGCKNKNTSDPSSSIESTIVGAYEVNADLHAAKLPDDAQNANDHAQLSSYKPISKYQPIVLLGRKKDTDTYYSILCYEDNSLQVLTLYENQNGIIEISSIMPFDLSEVAGTEHTIDKDKEDSFEANTDFEEQSLDENAQSAFNKATSNLSNDLYKPAALLGTQIVSGTNYAVLCASVETSFAYKNCWDVLTIYEDLEGNASISSIYEIDMEDFSQTE